MAVGHVGSATSGSQASVSSFNIGTLGTGARAGIVFVCIHNSATDIITGVTWNGATMSRLYYAADTNTEPGFTVAYFLDNITNGLITVSRTNNATVTVGYAASISAGAGRFLEVAQTKTVGGGGTVQTNANASETGTAASGEQALDDGSPGTNSLRYAAAYTGASTPLGAGTNSSALQSLDSSLYGSSFVRETTAGQGSRNVGFATGTTDDYAAVFVAVREGYTTVPGSFAANAVIKANSGTQSFTVDALILRSSGPLSWTSDAISLRTQGFSFLIGDPVDPGGAVIAGGATTVPGDFKVDAVLLGTTTPAGCTADAVLLASSGTKTFTADAIIKASSGTKTLVSDATILRVQTGSPTADAVVFASSGTKLTTADAIILRPSGTLSLTADAVISRTQSNLIVNLRQDQTNSAAYVAIYGDGGANEAAGQSFIAVGSVLTQIELNLWIQGSPTDNLQLEVAATIDGAAIGSGQIPAASVAGFRRFLPFLLSATLIPGETYYLRLSRTGVRDTSNYIRCYQSIGDAYAGGVAWTKSSSTWTQTSAYDRGFLISGPVFADADLLATIASALTADAIELRSQSASFLIGDAVDPGGAWIVVGGVTVPGSFAVDVVVAREQAGNIAFDATLLAARPGAMAVDAVIRTAFTGPPVSLNAIVLRPQSGTAFALDAIRLAPSDTKIFAAEAWLQATVQSAWPAEAILSGTVTPVGFLAEAWIPGQGLGAFDTNAIVFATPGGAVSVDAIRAKVESGTVALDAVVTRTTAASQFVDAIVLSEGLAGLAADAVLLGRPIGSFTVEAWIPGEGFGAFVVEAIVSSSTSVTFTLDAVRGWTVSGSTGLDSVLKTGTLAGLTADAVVEATRMVGFATDAVFLSPQGHDLALDAFIVLGSQAYPFTIDAAVTGTQSASLSADAALLSVGAGSLEIDVLLLRVQPGTLTLDAVLYGLAAFTVGAWIQGIGEEHFSLDASISPLISGTVEATFSARTISATTTAATVEATFSAATISWTPLFWATKSGSFAIASEVA